MIILLLFVLTEFVLATCFFAQSQLAYWAIAVAVCPLFMLFFHKKPTLRTSQNIYSVVFSLCFGTLLIFAGSNICASKAFYRVSDIVFCVAFFGILIAATAGFASLLCKIEKNHFGMFFFGTVFAIAYCCIPQTSLVLCAVAFGLLALSAIFFVASAMRLNGRLKVAAKSLDTKNVAPSLLARNLAFVATIVNLFFVLMKMFATDIGIRVANLSLNICCAVLDFALMFVYLRQPLNYVAEQKISLLQQKPNDVDESKVKEFLRKRLGEEKLYALAAMMKEILDAFMSMKVIGLEKVTESSTVFVANHYEIYGPMISVLKFPKAMRPWTDSMMTNKKTLARQLRSGLDIVTRKWVIKPIRKRLPQIVAKPLWKTLNYGRPISVYRRDPQKIEQMFEETNDALLTGDSIFVFPERPPAGEFYKDGGVDKFQTGFVEIAERYFLKTGKELNFYPIYIDKRGKKMTVGDKVTFNSAAATHDEKTRISEELYEKTVEMCVLAQKSRQKQ